jgi:hypothetical protein
MDESKAPAGWVVARAWSPADPLYIGILSFCHALFSPMSEPYCSATQLHAPPHLLVHKKRSLCHPLDPGAVAGAWSTGACGLACGGE